MSVIVVVDVDVDEDDLALRATVCSSDDKLLYFYV